MVDGSRSLASCSIRLFARLTAIYQFFFNAPDPFRLRSCPPSGVKAQRRAAVALRIAAQYPRGW